MTATNHVATGMVIGAAVSSPLLALPIAFASHFVLDALPHFGFRTDQQKAFRLLKYILVADSTAAAALLLAIAYAQPAGWGLMLACGIACASPDLWQIPRYIRYVRTGNTNPLPDRFSQFHHTIQRYERPWGAWVELLWLAGCSALLWRMVS